MRRAHRPHAIILPHRNVGLSPPLYMYAESYTLLADYNVTLSLMDKGIVQKENVSLVAHEKLCFRCDATERTREPQKHTAWTHRSDMGDNSTSPCSDNYLLETLSARIAKRCRGKMAESIRRRRPSSPPNSPPPLPPGQSSYTTTPPISLFGTRSCPSY